MRVRKSEPFTLEALKECQRRKRELKRVRKELAGYEEGKRLASRVKCLIELKINEYRSDHVKKVARSMLPEIVQEVWCAFGHQSTREKTKGKSYFKVYQKHANKDAYLQAVIPGLTVNAVCKIVFQSVRDAEQERQIFFDSALLDKELEDYDLEDLSSPEPVAHSESQDHLDWVLEKVSDPEVLLFLRWAADGSRAKPNKKAFLKAHGWTPHKFSEVRTRAKAFLARSYPDEVSEILAWKEWKRARGHQCDEDDVEEDRGGSEREAAR